VGTGLAARRKRGHARPATRRHAQTIKFAPGKVRICNACTKLPPLAPLAFPLKPSQPGETLSRHHAPFSLSLSLSQTGPSNLVVEAAGRSTRRDRVQGRHKRIRNKVRWKMGGEWVTGGAEGGAAGERNRRPPVGGGPGLLLSLLRAHDRPHPSASLLSSRQVSGDPERPRLAVFRSNNHIYAQVREHKERAHWPSGEQKTRGLPPHFSHPSHRSSTTRPATPWPRSPPCRPLSGRSWAAGTAATR